MAAPVNDNFANATEVVIAVDGGAFEPPLVSNAEASKEAGEPSAVAYSSERSCWWKYTPTSSGLARFDTQRTTAAGSGTDTQMAVYTGSWGSLTAVASDQDSGSTADPDGYPVGPSFTSRIRNLSVTAGTTYYVQVGAWLARAMNYGLRVVGPATAAPPPPAGALAGVFQPLVGAVAASSVDPPPVGDLTGVFPALVGSFTESQVVGGALAGSLPALSAVVSGTVEPVTESLSTYANDGYGYTGVGTVEYIPPIAATPARVRRVKVQHVHQSLPAPTLENGRPV